MVLFDVSINWLAVLLASIVAFVIGAIYYSPPLFGKMMMEQMPGGSNRSKKQQKMTAMPFVGAFVASLFSVFALEVLLKAGHIASFAAGLELAAIIWLGFYVSIELVGLAFSMKNAKLFVVNIVHYAIVLGVVSIILVALH